MSYQERSAWASGVIAVLGYAGYLAVVLARADGGPLAAVAYTGPLLVSVGAAVTAGIVTGMVLGALAGAERGIRDEREREIERLGSRVGQSFLVLGGVTGLVLALVEADPFWIANALYLGFVASAVLSAVARVAASRGGAGPW